MKYNQYGYLKTDFDQMVKELQLTSYLMIGKKIVFPAF